jgi:myo-inositol-1(or 4)-monophosphatase
MKKFNLYKSLNSQFLDLAVSTALEAGEIARNLKNKKRATSSKGVADYVTDLDLAIDRSIVEKFLAAGVKQSEIVSEESFSGDGKISDGWLIDPIDGTASLVWDCGDRYPSILIAHLSSGIVDCGVCYFPFTDELFYAVLGGGAFYQEEKIKKAESVDVSKAWVVLNCYGDSTKETKEFFDLQKKLRSKSGAGLVTTDLPQSGIGCRVALGKPNALIHDNGTHYVKQAPWDIAPIQLIVKEAGGVFCNFSGNEVSPFVSEQMIVAQDEKLAEVILNFIR